MTSNGDKKSSAPNSDQPVPIGVFWDIENCCVPKGKSALSLVQRIRDEFFTNHKETEFMCVCDINKENRDVIHELILAQVTVVHINATAKNAADDKLRHRLRRFANSQSPPATVLLVSGDVNFASELSDLRHHHKLHIILVHPNQTQKALKQCAHQCFPYEKLINDLPGRKPEEKTKDDFCELEVENLPTNKSHAALQNRLKLLAANCGGKVTRISGTFAQLKFPNHGAASRYMFYIMGKILEDKRKKRTETGKGYETYYQVKHLIMKVAGELYIAEP